MAGIFENRDCMEAMREMPDKAFDLAIVDPPYGINYARDAAKHNGKVYRHAEAPRGTYTAYDWDKTRPSPEYFVELRRISKNQIIWGGGTIQTYCLRRDAGLYGIRSMAHPILLILRWLGLRSLDQVDSYGIDGTECFNRI